MIASSLLLAVVKYGLLALIWAFVLVAFRTVRSDLFGTRPAQAVAGGPAPAAVPDRARRDGRSAARQLVVTEGALAGTTISLGTSAVSLGRADGSTLVLTDDYASSHHARLVPGEDAWLIEDLGSTNGTYLGPDRVVEPIRVPLGAPIRIGRTVLELRR